MIELLCKYAPLELLKGFSFESLRVNPVVARIDIADQLTHRNICSFTRAYLESKVQEKNRQPVLLTSCCNSMEALFNALRELKYPVKMLPLPYKTDPCTARLYQQALLKLIEDIELKTGSRFDLEAFRAAFPEPAQPDRKNYIAILGSRIPDYLKKKIMESSPLPVVDYTCNMERCLPQPPPELTNLEELISWYAQILLGQRPCLRMSDTSSRRHLLGDPFLKGIIYATVNFCDFYGFEYGWLKHETMIPLMKLETDYTTQGQGQIKTRLEAFYENLIVDSKPVMKSDEGYFVGIDSGSTSTNVVLLNSDGKMVAFESVPTGVNMGESAQEALNKILKQSGLTHRDVQRTVTTGYGRNKIGFDTLNVTEITCHAAGAYFLNPNVRTVIDIGGQDSKIIRLDEEGNVIDFVMNDKCAAGTGRFLEMMAFSLELSLAEMSERGLSWKNEISISSMCSVFAQSEVVTLIAEGHAVEDIIHGLNLSVASRVLALGGQRKLESQVMITGGVAYNRGTVAAIEEKLGKKLYTCRNPEICGALGAALIAWQGGI